MGIDAVGPAPISRTHLADGAVTPGARWNGLIRFSDARAVAGDDYVLGLFVAGDIAQMGTFIPLGGHHGAGRPIPRSRFGIAGILVPLKVTAAGTQVDENVHPAVAVEVVGFRLPGSSVNVQVTR